MIPSPVGLSILDWSDQVCFNLDKFGPFEKLKDPLDWQNWGAKLLGPVALGGYVLANPYQFSNWTDWADSVYKELS